MYSVKTVRKLISSCLSKDISHPDLCKIHVGTGYIVATDGHRMIRVHKTDGYRDLLADAKMGQVAEGSESKADSWLVSVWPDLDPEGHEKFIAKVPALFGGVKGRKSLRVVLDPNGVYCIGRDPSDGEIVLDARYLAPLAGLECRVYWAGPEKPVLFHCEVLMLEMLIMPMRA